MKRKVIIIGAGIAGMTAAHELIEKNFDVFIFEKENELGGMAKGSREKMNIPSEHSWRGYAPFYKNTFETMKRISISNNKTVYNNLAKPINFYLLSDNRDAPYKPNYTISDKFVLIYYGLKYLMSNNRRKEYYKTKLLPLINNKLSKYGKINLIDFTLGPGLGMEKKDASYGHLFKVGVLAKLNEKKYEHEHIYDNKIYHHEAEGQWHVMNKPTSEAWFLPWKNLLIKKGVKIFKNSELWKINAHNNDIISCTIKNNNNFYNMKADEYIICINPYEAETIFKRSDLNNLYKQHHEMNKHTVSNQISFRIGLNKTIKFPDNVAFVMIDSEFNITWYPQEKHWISLNLDNNIQSLWSGTIIDAYTRGKIYNKPAIELNKHELINEIINQILRSKSFQKLIYEFNEFYLSKKDIIYTEIWKDWHYDKHIKKLVTLDKKWVNNIYNEQYRISQKTNFNNLYIGGAHTKTSINIWSMEGAIESGKIISNIIFDKYNLDKTYLFKHNDPIIFYPLKYIDDVLYFFNLPNIIDTIILLIIFLFIYFVITKLKLTKKN